MASLSLQSRLSHCLLIGSNPMLIIMIFFTNLTLAIKMAENLPYNNELLEKSDENRNERKTKFSVECGLHEMPVLIRNNGGSPELVCQQSDCLAQSERITCQAQQNRACSGRNQWLRGWSSTNNKKHPTFVCCSSPNVIRSELIRTAPILDGHTGIMRGFSEVHYYGKKDVHFQFGEALTSVEVRQQEEEEEEDNGSRKGGPASTTVLLFGVSRFKCGSQLVHNLSPSSHSPAAGQSHHASTIASTASSEKTTTAAAGRRSKRWLNKVGSSGTGGMREPLDKPACDGEWKSTETVTSLASNREGQRNGGGGIRISSSVSQISDVGFCGVSVTRSQNVQISF